MDIGLELQYYLGLKSQFDEAFDDISYKNHEWGAKFSFPGIGYVNQNFAMVLTKSNDIDDLVKWVKEEPERKLLVYQQIKIQPALVKSATAKLISRTKKKINFPILDFGLIQSYSYQTNQNSSAIRNLVPIIAEIADKNNNANLEKLIGGFLHLNNGKIWTLEVDDGNVVAAAIEVTHDDYPKNRSIEFVVTRENFRNRQYDFQLIQAILSENWKHTFVCLQLNGGTDLNLETAFEFDEVMNFDVYY